MKPYPKDFRFDWYPKFEVGFCEPTVDILCNAINQKRSKRGQSAEQIKTSQTNERKTLEQILLALYQAYCVLPIGSCKVSIPLTAGHYQNSSKDLGKVNGYSYRDVIKVFQILEEHKWIDKSSGSTANGLTRIRAKGDLVKIYNYIGLKWFPQIPVSSSELVVLRDYKNPEGKTKKDKGSKINIDLPISDVVNLYRSSLYQYNQFLTQHCVALDLDDDQMVQLGQVMTQRSEEDIDDWWAEKDQRMDHIDLSRIQLRRIFSRGVMSKGGRFYGGWWQSIPSDYRAHITIDGLKICEVDYSSMSLRIIYAEQGIEIPVEDDLYDIGLPDWQGISDPRRKPIKTFINAILNDENGRYRLPKEKQELVGISHAELMVRLREKHADIADEFNTGIGLHTQFVDSQIAELVMHNMMKDGIPVLPIHDSFIVRAGYEQWISVVMEEAFQSITKGLAGVEADGPRLQKHFGMSKEKFNVELQKLDEDPSYGIVNQADVDFDEFIKMGDALMAKYLGSWEQWKKDQA
jgi:hypothetical protein